MKPILKVLFCDDNAPFAQTQVESLTHKLFIRYGILPETCAIRHLSQLKQVQHIAHSKEALQWHCIFCDLGWSELSLEGIQILHNIQLQNPHVFTVLYTAQDEAGIVGQTLQWQLDFIDRIIKINSTSYFEEMLEIILERFAQKRLAILQQLHKEGLLAKLETQAPETLRLGEYSFQQLFPECYKILHEETAESSQRSKKFHKKLNQILDQLDVQNTANILLSGTRLLAKDRRGPFIQRALTQLSLIKKPLQDLLQDEAHHVAFSLCISKDSLHLKLQPNPLAQQQERYSHLLANLQRFPQVENHDLLAFEKARFIEFVREQHGGFPQLAEARGIDLNHIYRVQRKFKQSPFVVFKYETIKELLGIYEQTEMNKAIQDLLAEPETILQFLK